MSDPVNPAHYQAIANCPHCGGAIEAITITERFGFVVGNVLKYALRAGRKEGTSAAQDFDKCAWYANRAAQHARRGDGRHPTGPRASFPPVDSRQPTPGLYGPENRITIEAQDMPVTVEKDA